MNHLEKSERNMKESESDGSFCEKHHMAMGQNTSTLILTPGQMKRLLDVNLPCFGGEGFDSRPSSAQCLLPCRGPDGSLEPRRVGLRTMVETTTGLSSHAPSIQQSRVVVFMKAKLLV